MSAEQIPEITSNSKNIFPVPTTPRTSAAKMENLSSGTTLRSRPSQSPAVSPGTSPRSSKPNIGIKASRTSNDNMESLTSGTTLRSPPSQSQTPAVSPGTSPRSSKPNIGVKASRTSNDNMENLTSGTTLRSPPSQSQTPTVSPGTSPRSSKPNIGIKASRSIVVSNSGTIGAIESDQSMVVNTTSGNNNILRALLIPPPRRANGLPRFINAHVFVTFFKKSNGLYNGVILLDNPRTYPVAFKVDSTDPDLETFDYFPSSLGIISPKGQAKVEVVTRNKLGWGDVRKHLFLVQSIPLEAPIEEPQEADLAHFWTEDSTLMNAEKMLLVPKTWNTSFLNEPSILEEAVQGYLNSFLVRLNRYFRLWFDPYYLDHPLIMKDYPQAYRQLEDRVWQDSWLWSFKNRFDLINSEKERYGAVESAYRCGRHRIFILFICLVTLCITVWCLWNGIIAWDEYRASRDAPWYRKLFKYFFKS